MKHLLFLVLILIGLAQFAQAQVPDELNTTAPRPAASVLDTAAGRALPTPAAKRAAKRTEAIADSAKRTERLFGLRLTRPGKAALLAAIAPGAGQIYNGSWWKLPLVYGSLGGIGYAGYYSQKGFNEYAEAYNAIVDGKSKVGDPGFGTRARQERSLQALDRGITFYRGNRDLFILYFGLAYGLQIVDALVDAHLKSFDVSDDLSLHWEPALLPVPGSPFGLPTAPGAVVALRFK